MAERVSLQFSTGSQENAERFIEHYLLDALDRVPEMDACDSFTFVPGHPATGDRTAGLQVPSPDHPIYLTIRGETDEIIDAERDRWNSLVEDGVVTEWEKTKTTDRAEMVEELGEERATLLARSSNLSAQMAKLAYEEFDELGVIPAAVETYPDEESDAAPFGWWAVIHTVTVQLNYSLAEELDAYRYGIEHTLRNFAEFEGADEAETRLDDLIADLETMREAVKEGRLDS
jgi:hypothetical protein